MLRLGYILLDAINLKREEGRKAIEQKYIILV